MVHTAAESWQAAKRAGGARASMALDAASSKLTSMEKPLKALDDHLLLPPPRQRKPLQRPIPDPIQLPFPGT